ncbi:MAG: TolC family protein [Nannocystaceae bacterium]
MRRRSEGAKRRRTWRRLAAASLVWLAALGCGHTGEATARRHMHGVERGLAPLPAAAELPPTGAAAPAVAELDGSLVAYVRYAMAHSPQLRARFEEWRAATHAPREARAFPELVIGYAGCIVGAELCVGPMGQRLGAKQWFPWPATLTKASKAGTAAAFAAERRFEAESLMIATEVKRAYWRLWQVRERRRVQADQVTIVRGLSELVRARVETGAAGLGALAQVDLTIARLEDRQASLDLREREAAAELVRATGAPPRTPTPTTTAPPPPGALADDEAALARRALQHPELAALDETVDAQTLRAAAYGARRMPSLGLGADWIIGRDATATSPERMHMLMVSASVKVPLSFGAIRAGQDRIEAEAAATRARQIAAQQAILADLAVALARLDDATRRVELYSGTLQPQAETALGSLQGAFQAGEAGLSDLLLVERDLLDIELARVDASVDYAIALAELEALLGRASPEDGVDVP